MQLLNSSELTDRQSVDSFVAKNKQNILDGAIDWRELLRQKKMIDEALTAMFKDPEIKSYLQDEYHREGLKKVPYKGVDITFVSNRGKATFEQCNDKILERLESDPTYVAHCQLIEQRKEMLKGLKHMVVETDPVTGETFEKYPPAYTGGSDYFTVTLKKD